MKDEEWEIENGIVMKEGKIYVLEGKLRREIIRLHHDIPVGGHGGRLKTMELVTRNYWWPGVMKEVGKYWIDAMLVRDTRIKVKYWQRS